MARVTNTEVHKIMTNLASTYDTTPFITAANLTVTQALSGSGMSDALMKEIERWYTAHLVTTDPSIPGGTLKSKKIGPAEETYATPGGFGKLVGLKSTLYGQRVLEMDYTGNMAKLGKRQAVLTHINVSPDTGE